MSEQTDQTGRPEVVIVQQAADVVQVMRTWTVTAPDWTPPYRARAIAPTKVVAVWVDGVISRVSVSGPYRMKSGAEAQPKHSTDESHIGGTGQPDHRIDRDRMQYVNVCADGRWDRYTRDQFPAWAEEFVTANAPVEVAR